MKHHSLLVVASSCCAVSLFQFSLAGDIPARFAASAAAPEAEATTPRWRADDHAPLGVTGDHLHRAGDWMVGVSAMRMQMDGHRRGRDQLSDREVYALTAPNGDHYSMVAGEMNMDMVMAHIMWAPTDWLTLMLMPQWVRTEMEMRSNPHAEASDHGAGMAGMHHGATGGGNHSHSSEGFGDLPLVALFRLWRGENRSLHLGFGVSIPTGSVDAQDDGTYLPYDMQIGSGTWDFLPSLTWTQRLGRFGYGAQLAAVLPIYPETNGAGFQVGDQYSATTWASWRVADGLSLSARLLGTREENVDGHYNGPHDHGAPNHFQGNVGGTTLDLGLGANFVITDGPLAGHRFGAEWLLPVYQDLNGIGMNREWTLAFGWSTAF